MGSGGGRDPDAPMATPRKEAPESSRRRLSPSLQLRRLRALSLRLRFRELRRQGLRTRPGRHQIFLGRREPPRVGARVARALVSHAT